MNIPTHLLQQAAHFHGHLGPYLVLGLKMGILARNLLDGTPFTMKAEVHTQKKPPHSCIVDGIQFTSGCTLGKGNICIKEDQKIYGVFTTGSETVTIIVNTHLLKTLQTIAREELEGTARALFAKEDEELFEVVP
ncbi:MAG: formylmethanofuran dehydrogenase subunit E family protein [Theionarchaea archaeon]|nr:MAG: hypothetical protein AYK19_16670 [Theionarchaea archaeon DG-70-1]MBU7030753.1 formylmethanofuran dehydrogenase subunit E family protein [Theionarchaea archaeon]